MEGIILGYFQVRLPIMVSFWMSWYGFRSFQSRQSARDRINYLSGNLTC